MSWFSNNKASLDWKIIERTMNSDFSRLKVPNGWLIRSRAGFSQSITFYPDPEHDWMETLVSFGK